MACSSASPQASVEGGVRTLLYAGLLAAPMLLVRDGLTARRWAIWWWRAWARSSQERFRSA